METTTYPTAAGSAASKDALNSSAASKDALRLPPKIGFVSLGCP